MIETARGAVECVRSGEGAAVLLLHGAMGGYDQGLHLGQAALGSTGFEFIAVSRPGYLRTPLALGPTPEQQADLCAGVLDALAIRQAAAIAISGGGQCALQFALRHPGRCRALVMISACSAPLTVRVPLRFHLMTLMTRLPGVLSSMRRKAENDPEWAAGRAIPDPALRAKTLNDPEAGPLLRAHLLSTMDRMAERLPGTRNDIAQSRAPFAYPVERILAPVLIVHGTADQAVPFAQAESLAARLVPGELLSTSFQVFFGRRTSVDTSVDAAGTSARATVGYEMVFMKWCTKDSGWPARVPVHAPPPDPATGPAVPGASLTTP
ncbi:Alpha/beta hydrolase fold [Candidatus Sulfopaludibacter sp. SbA4]|nr:Alpha/beta hydrolase fold [Candidatus Sulfopaludibacter sp. SbA4]